MTIDWTKPICIAATDWQDELPARVVRQERDGSYYVAIDKPHKLDKAGRVWGNEGWWFCINGTMGSAGSIRVINKIEKEQSKMPTQKSLDEAARAAGYSSWVAAQCHSEPATYDTQSIAAHALTLDQLHGRVEVSDAERLYREVIIESGYQSDECFFLAQNDLAAIAILEKALADAANKSDGWIEWHGGECPVAYDTRVEVKFRDGHTDNEESAEFWAWRHYALYGDIVAYRVL